MRGGVGGPRAAVTGIGWVAPGGYGRGRADPAPAWGPGALPEIPRALVFPEPTTRFGRMDEVSKVGLAAVALALADAGLAAFAEKRPVGLVASTRYGCLPTDLAYWETARTEGGKLASPQLFAYTLPNCFLGEAAIRFGLTGPTYAVQEEAPWGLGALAQGLELLTLGEAAAVAVGICDLPCPPALPPAPDVEAGALFLVLEPRPQPGVSPYGACALAPDGRVRCRGRAVSSLAALAAILLTRPPTSGDE